MLFPFNCVFLNRYTLMASFKNTFHFNCNEDKINYNLVLWRPREEERRGNRSRRNEKTQGERRGDGGGNKKRGGWEIREEEREEEIRWRE